MSNLAKLEILDPDIVCDFLETGKSSAIAKHLQEYIHHLQWAAEIWNTERNTSRAAKKLRVRIQATLGKTVSIQTCLNRLFDSMNYFDVDSNVSQEIWDRDTANKFEDLAVLAIAQDKLDTASRAYNKANELRARANSAIKPAELQPPLFLIDTKISAEDLGFKNEKLLSITRKSNEGYYARLISELPIEKQEKLRLLSDAEISDIDFEDIEDE